MNRRDRFRSRVAKLLGVIDVDVHCWALDDDAEEIAKLPDAADMAIIVPLDEMDIDALAELRRTLDCSGKLVFGLSEDGTAQLEFNAVDVQRLWDVAGREGRDMLFECYNCPTTARVVQATGTEGPEGWSAVPGSNGRLCCTVCSTEEEREKLAMAYAE